MTSEKRAANAVGGKTARPCDSCLCKRARWYCAADDAFLCQSCDSSVHSANPLARRHERLSLKTATSSLRPERAEKADRTDAIPAWLSGFRRKARTPRHAKPIAKAEPVQAPLLVPDLSSGDDPSIVDEEQLLYRVPIFDPIDAAIIPSVNSTPVSDIESKPSVPPDGGVAEIAATADYMADFGTCDAELAVDVESLFGKGLEGEDFCMEALGLMESGGEGGEMDWSVKVEEVEDARMDGCHVDVDLDLSSHTLEMKFGYESPTTAAMACEEEEAMADVKKENKIFLRLNYEAIITEWASQGSPWTTGDRPNFNPDDCWPDWTRGCGTDHMQYDIGGQLMVGDRGREARVSRYREKRRSRLFSKKIRYEVRKLNAEKRPRMKGRFVKRASLAGPTTAFPF